MKIVVALSIRQSSLAVWSGLLLLLLLAVWLRWDVYPRTYFADELIPRAVVKHMQESNSLDTNWENADWTGDFAGGFYKLKQYNFSSYHIFLLGLRKLSDGLGLGAVSDLVLYRLASLLLQLLGIVLVFSIAARLAGDTYGLLAAASLVVMPQAVVDAHYVRPESFVVFLVALASWLAMKSYVMGAVRYGFSEAFVWGVAVACKFSFLPMVIVAFIANIYRYRNAGMSVLWLGFLLLGVACSAPYIFLDLDGFFHGVGLLLSQYSPDGGKNNLFHDFFPSSRQLFPYLISFFSIPFLFVALMSFSCKDNAGRVFSLASLAVTMLYILVFARQGVFFERNLSHLLPLWSVMFSLGFRAAFGFMNRNSFIVISVLLLMWPFYLSFNICRVFFRDLPAIQEDVTSFQRKKFLDAKVVSYKMMGNVDLDGLSEGQVLRVPAHKLDGVEQVYRFLQDSGYEPISTIDLPLSYLPYNQLQINQLPPGYRYFIKRSLSSSGAAQ